MGSTSCISLEDCIGEGDGHLLRPPQAWNSQVVPLLAEIRLEDRISVQTIMNQV